MSSTNVKILERAQVPIRPVRPRKALNVALALVLGTFAGGMLALLFESLDQTIKSPEDIDRFLKLTALVVLPVYQLEKGHADLSAEFLTAKARHSTVAEAFRSLRTSIIFSNPDLRKKTFLVTSASPSEGKTTVAVNLATVFAHSEERVLLVDTDLRNPRLHSVFKELRANGVTDLIALQKNEIEDFIRKTEIPGVDLLTCGELPPVYALAACYFKMGDLRGIHRQRCNPWHHRECLRRHLPLCRHGVWAWSWYRSSDSGRCRLGRRRRCESGICAS